MENVVKPQRKVKPFRQKLRRPEGRSYLRAFTYEDHVACFAPPFNESNLPDHWPADCHVSTLPRVGWLPPGWGQAWKDGCDRKFYVAPASLGAKVMVNKLNVELTVGKKLKPMDQHGVLLGDEYIRKWPNWLPKDWRIAYFRSAGGAPKPCFLSPRGAHYKDKKAVLAQKAKERKVQLGKAGSGSLILAKRARKRLAPFRRKSQERSKECFRTFTPQELFECFAPPLGDSLTPPSHWQGGLKVSRLPRISWLPPRWTQAYRDGSRRKLYVAPPELGAKVVFHRENVEVLEGRRLSPVDQHGLVLGPDCITQWPNWLPKDWQIGYYRPHAGAPKVCFLSPEKKRFTDRQQVLSHLNPNSQPKKPAVCRVKLGDFARRHAFLIRQKQICSLRTSLPFVPADDSEDEFPETCDVFRSFTYQEFKDCFAPPLGDCTVPPSHWPEGLQVCTLPRISWLPPGWGQGIRMGQKGRRLKVFVAPEGHGRLVVNNKQSMEVILQTRLRPLDQYGKVLGLGDECVEHWPKWLPRTWRIAYFKEDGNVKVCYISPAGDKCLEKAAVMSKAREQRVVEKANEAEAERMRKRRRLRKMNSEALCLDEQQDQQDAENENEEVAEQAAEKAAAEAHAEAEAAEAEQSLSVQVPVPAKSAGARRKVRSRAEARPQKRRSDGRVPCAEKLERQKIGKPGGFDPSTLSESDLQWLTKHPLYTKIHERGYPIPIGDQDILALKPFTPKAFGGDAELNFY
ncbi:unnamed protein product [Durusdinium trenchii]|uniref:GTPase Der n=2 Tax=Durusdinium trenchii TaxID=1381693 RepID=A0ABP0HCQ8_9DINO